MPTALRLPRHRANFTFTHRFNGNLRGRSFGANASSLFGLDDGATIGLDFRYAVTSRLEAAIFRTNVGRTIQLYAKGDLLYQRAGGPPLSLSAIVSDEGTNNFRAERAPAVGLTASHAFGTRLNVYVMPMWVHNTFPSSGSTRDTGLVGVAGRLRLLHSVFLVGEVSPRIAGYRPGQPEYGFAIEKRIGGHVFQLNFTDTPAMTFAQLARGGFPKSLYMGFNLSRKFF